MTIDFIKRYYPIHQEDWEWNFVYSKNIFMEDVEQNLHLPWNWFYLSQHPNVNMDYIRKHMNDFPWNWETISFNPNLTMQDLIEWKHLLNWRYVSSNKAFTMKMIESTLHIFPWDLCRASSNPNITIEFIQSHPEVDWNWVHISRSMNFSVNPWPWDLEMFPSVSSAWPWNLDMLCRNPSVTINMLEKYSNDISIWGWKWLASNPHIFDR
jgi:hypothetical protein